MLLGYAIALGALLGSTVGSKVTSPEDPLQFAKGRPLFASDGDSNNNKTLLGYRPSNCLNVYFIAAQDCNNQVLPEQWVAPFTLERVPWEQANQNSSQGSLYVMDGETPLFAYYNTKFVMQGRQHTAIVAYLYGDTVMQAAYLWKLLGSQATELYDYRKIVEAAKEFASASSPDRDAMQKLYAIALEAAVFCAARQVRQLFRADPRLPDYSLGKSPQIEYKNIGCSIDS